MNDSMRVLSGSLALGRYRVVKELARGGMGMVYLGRIEGAAGFAKPVVIKRVLSHIDESDGSRAQFIREARLLSELNHPNIVGVIDFGEESDSYLMILEYVHGYHLGNWLRYVRRTRGRLEWDFAVYATVRVLSALHYAHTRVGPEGKVNPIIHRDVSPGNVLLDLQGNVRLLDFGIARATEETDEFKTQEGIVKGKLPYIAPEMYQSSEASVASDVYATGVMLYQLLSGKNPFSGKDMSAIVTRVLQYTPPPISSLREDTPKELDAVIGRAIAKKPGARYESAQAFAQALGGLLQRSEAELVESLRAAVSVDFTGDMPSVLGVPSLADLDQSWRASSPEPEEAEALHVSSLAPEEISTAIVDVVPGKYVSDATIQGRGAAPSRASEPPQELTTGSAQAAPGSTRAIVLGMIGAGLLAGVVIAGVLLWGQSNAPAGQRFLLVERPGGPQQAHSPSSGSQTEPPVEKTKGGADASEESKQEAKPTELEELTEVKRSEAEGPRAKPTRASEPERLTASFARRQAAVQGCFSKAAGALEGTPQLSVHFQLDAQGRVKSATLTPAGLAGTSLGQCLLGVARGTKFPASGKPVAFAIPITARVRSQ